MLLLSLNLACWIWAYHCFQGRGLLLGTAFLAYLAGLRHAVDADHIAAIDNVTRKLMQDGQRPVGGGLFFAVGHCAVVLLASIVVGLSAAAMSDIAVVKTLLGTIADGFSAVFLLTLAAMNAAVFLSTYRRYRKARSGPRSHNDVALDLQGRGFVSRLFRPMFRLVSHSWHMAPIGFLFALGFDSASEVALLGLSGGAAKGLPLSIVLVFPTLFAAGMCLVDTTDGLVMLRAYEWACARPDRNLSYNLGVTLLSIVVAVAVGGAEAAALLAEKLHLTGALWDLSRWLTSRFTLVGLTIVALFLLSWVAARLIYWANRREYVAVTECGA